jgi:hypothetical protein
VVTLPWERNLAGPQSVWFAVYNKTRPRSRAVRLRLAISKPPHQKCGRLATQVRANMLHSCGRHRTDLVKTRSAILVPLLIVAVFGQGCFYRYTTTPPVSGTVIDARTNKPIAGARIGFRKHEGKISTTSLDGSFHLPSDHMWAFSPLIPFEFTPCGGVFFVEALGYKSFEQDIGQRVYRPFTFAGPIVLRQEPR